MSSSAKSLPRKLRTGLAAAVAGGGHATIDDADFPVTVKHAADGSDHGSVMDEEHGHWGDRKRMIARIHPRPFSERTLWG
jgi:hypothetical protein